LSVGVSRAAHLPVIGVWLRRTGLVSVTCLCLSGIAGCGASAGGREATSNGPGADGAPGAAFLTFYCPLSSVASTSAEQALIARAGVDRGLCSATDATRTVVVAALGRLPRAQQATLDGLAAASSIGASSPQAGVALQITDGVLAGATMRALPAPPATTISPTAPFGQPQGSPAITALIRAAVDPASDPPCTPESKSSPEPPSAGQSLVQSATEALARHDSFRGVLLAVVRELANEKFCDRLAELIRQLARAAKAVTDPDLVGRLVLAQAHLEGVHEVPPATTAAYSALRKRAIRAYILSGQLTEVEEQSGGSVALNADLLAARAGQPRAPGDTAILAEEIAADNTMEPREGG
jgi:hypothetical protein